ncbi:LrgB family protein [Companilactobacillus sp.]|uniref:LrgB family protein n=1 Tax=Companilactobacillus sp. TaxID=2767905 RepID=UPI0025BBA0D5|nr:LrgB family protein [Companilactobacillus sp.]MCH4131469.1 LrgB family protein [Companilactobacillus sp.]MCH4149401.1 LrgB family protein [Companilactobacillus sp.]MCI1310639.1 LrgB family protein [Companilactobacillus sp.]MCI1342026.1 LrgB family protein [Companilactobacillus sp.]MCI1409167.1 LrgB family protein [Companilactobacillus sp.]
MQIINNSFFGIFVSVVVYLIGVFLFRKSKGFFLFQPLFVGMVLGIFTLWTIQHLTGASPETVYNAYWKGGNNNFIGANFLFWMLGPATIAFAVPLYKRNDLVKKYWVEILLALIVGLFISLSIIYVITKALGLSNTEISSLLPTAATTAIAMPLAQGIGGEPAITAMTCILNAVIILAIGDQLVRWFRLDKDPIGVGLGLGTSGKTVGSAKAVQLGSIQGAMASISLVVIGVVTDLVVPIFAKWVGLV